MDVLVDVGLEHRGSPRGFRPRRRWLITVLEGLSWEGRTRVAGHFSGGETHKNTLKQAENSLFMSVSEFVY